MKGNQKYNDLVNGVVSYLLNEGLILEGTPPAKVSITNKGIKKCKEDSNWNSRYYPFKSHYIVYGTHLSHYDHRIVQTIDMAMTTNLF